MRCTALVVLLVLGGCVGAGSKTPDRFHTLLSPEPAASSPAAAPSRTAYVDVLPVQVPAQVDNAQWVVRQPDATLLVLEQDRWASPLPDEVRGAVVERLASRWGAVDVRAVGLPPAAVWRVRIDVQRFESIPGREARLEAAWSVSLPASAAPPRDAWTLVCRSVFVDAVADGGVAALAAGQRHNVTKLADAIGERLTAGAGTGGCP
jgi:uncharacterized lipoprotein YmbA